MPQKLIRHGTNAGYKAEIVLGDACDRCRKAHNVYQRQYTKIGRKTGLKYTGDQVLDHLWSNQSQGRNSRVQAKPAYSPRTEKSPIADDYTLTSGPIGPEPVMAPSEPTLADRLTGALGQFVKNDSGNEYVESDEPPDYLSESDPDPEPSGEWSQVTDDESYVINAAGMRAIEDNLGTYLSVIGMTVEMIDPYCGPVLAENFDNIVTRWSKVIAHYPKAANLFLDGRGGVLMNWMGAIQATWPVLMAFYHHHLSRDVKVEDGVIYRRNKSAGAPVDSTTPPMPDQFQYSAA